MPPCCQAWYHSVTRPLLHRADALFTRASPLPLLPTTTSASTVHPVRPPRRAPARLLPPAAPASLPPAPGPPADRARAVKTRIARALYSCVRAMADTSDGESLSRAQVRDIFSMATEDWVRSFLLTVDPVEDARMLTSPLEGMHALSGEHIFTVNKTVSGVSEPRVLSRWLLVPSFNRGSKAAGLFIQNKSDAVCADGTTMHFVRFVRNDDTGEVLYITEIPESGCFEVMHNLHEGPTRRRASYLRFDATRFRRVFAPSRANTDVSALRDALLTSCTITETRACPRCGSGPEAQCACTLALRKADHSHDFRFYRRNSENMFGTFSGRMTLSTYAAGQERSCQMYRVENSTHCTGLAFANDLLRGAVQNRFRLLDVNPRALSVMPPWKKIAAASITNSPYSSEERQSIPPSDNWVFFDTIDRIAEDDVAPVTPEDEDCPSPPLAMQLAGPLGSLMAPLFLSPTSTTWPVKNSSPPGTMPGTIGIKLPSAACGGRGVAPLLPRMGDPKAAVAVAAATVNTREVALDKSTMRKIKKRMAAEKSNFKRHQRHVQLKGRLQEVHKQESELRKRKAALEKENAELKHKLALQEQNESASHVSYVSAEDSDRSFQIRESSFDSFADNTPALPDILDVMDVTVRHDEPPDLDAPEFNPGFHIARNDDYPFPVDCLLSPGSSLVISESP